MNVWVNIWDWRKKMKEFFFSSSCMCFKWMNKWMPCQEFFLFLLNISYGICQILPKKKTQNDNNNNNKFQSLLKIFKQRNWEKKIYCLITQTHTHTPLSFRSNTDDHFSEWILINCCSCLLVHWWYNIHTHTHTDKHTFYI